MDKRPDHGKHPKRTEKQTKETLSIVLKTDTVGIAEAVISGLDAIQTEEFGVEIIHAGTGNVSKSDLFMAETGNRLVIGFNVDLLPKIKDLSSEFGIEVRLYDVIYNLIDDARTIAGSLVPLQEEEKITGRAKVIALFPGYIGSSARRSCRRYS